MVERASANAALLPALLALASCATGYTPLPLDLDAPLPDDAFERCAVVLRSCYGALVEADAAAFLLQSDWAAVADEPSERRASVFRDGSCERSLAIVVERRRLTVPVMGSPYWTTSRGDDAAERELAELLREALSIAPRNAAAPQRP